MKHGDLVKVYIECEDKWVVYRIKLMGHNNYVLQLERDGGVTRLETSPRCVLLTEVEQMEYRLTGALC